MPPAPDNPATLPSVWVIVVAGGSGTRFGGPKQYENLAGPDALEWSVATAASVGDGVVVVVPGADVEGMRERLASSLPETRDVALDVVAGGDTRADSVRSGLAAVPGSASVILVHDAARPAASPELFARVVDAVLDLSDRPGTSGVVPAVPVSDSIRHRRDGAVDRRELVAVQTPQGFLADRLRAAHRTGPDATDDASLVEALGDRIDIIDGEATNVKLTYAHDRAVLETALSARSVREGRP